MHTKVYTKPENITYAQKELLKIAEKRQLKAFWEKTLNGKGFNFFYLWNIMTGKCPASLEFIWALHKQINPVLWFYTVSEKKPNTRYSFGKDPEHYEYFGSKNFKFIEGIEKLNSWCKENELNYNLMFLLRTQKRRVTYQRIRTLKNILPVSGWFSFQN